VRCREEIQEQLLPLVMDTDVSMEVSGFAALALGLVFCCTCNGDISEGLLSALMVRGEAELSSPAAKQMALALGLLFLGKQEACEATLEVRGGCPCGEWGAATGPCPMRAQQYPGVALHGGCAAGIAGQLAGEGAGREGHAWGEQRAQHGPQ
jgi:hypothetical protein